MKNVKKYKISIISLLVAFLLSLTAAVSVLAARVTTVYADKRYVKLDGNTVFYTKIQGAKIEYTDPEEDGAGGSHRYTLFKVENDQTISYRQDLAYNWKEGKKDADGNPTGELNVVNGKEDMTFSMELAFRNADFKRYIIKFQSQQYNYTEDQISENYFIFTPAEDNKIALTVAQTLEEDEEGKIKQDPVTVEKKFALNEKIIIKFGDYSQGDYPLIINGNETAAKFKNVYKGFASYVSSGDLAVTPMTFTAETELNQSAEMILYSINGQSFEVFENGDTYKVLDTAAPVICFKQTPSYFEYAKTIGFDYKVIDVLSTNTKATVYYYLLTGDQYGDGDFPYNKWDYTAKEEDKTEDGAEGSDGAEGDKKTYTDPYTAVAKNSEMRLIRDADTFVPYGMIEDGDVYGLVKAYIKIEDVTNTSTAKKDVLFIDWFAKDEALVDLKDLKGAGESAKFIKLIDRKITTDDANSLNLEGATYFDKNKAANPKPDLPEAYKTSVQDFQTWYQAEIDKAIDKLEDGKLYAGSDNKFYLPSFEEYFTGKLYDDYDNIGDYKFSIYYKAKTSGSSTSLAINKLAIPLTEADVTYSFTIYMTDSMGNPMCYPSKYDSTSGKLVWEEISTGNVWDKDYYDLLPRFEFPVSYKEATAEEPENLALAYVNSSYSGVSFKINGVSDTYTTQYDLYVFDRNKYNGDKATNVSYDDFVKDLPKLLNNAETRKYFTMVKASNQLLETDADYDYFKAINWSSSNVSFTPQNVEDFYVVRLTLTDNRSEISTQKYATVAASTPTKSLKGESDWLENNLTSVILLSVAGVCLIALVILLIVKPKDKGDIDAIYDREAEKENKKAQKKAKKQTK